MARSEEPGIATSIAYAAGSFATGVFSTVPAILLLYFCTEFAGIRASLAAVIVFVPKAWSVFWDPFIGNRSDASRSPFGRRLPFMIAGALGVVLCFVALFRPPVTGLPWGFVWIASAYFLLTTFYSAYAVPYVALPAELGNAPATRSRLVSWRMTAAMIGVAAGAGVAPILVEMGGGALRGYGYMAVVIALGCAVTMASPIAMLCIRNTPTVNRLETSNLLEGLRTALRHDRFRTLILAYILLLTATGVLSSVAPYLVTRVLGRSQGDIGIAMLLMLGTTIVSVPLWSWAGRKIGDHRALGAAIVLYTVFTAFLGFAAAQGLGWNILLGGFFLLGIPFAAVQVLPYTIVAHLIHEESRNGPAAEGTFTGVWTASEKLGLAFGPALTGIALAITHADYRSLPVFVAVCPAVLFLLSLPLVAAALPGLRVRHT